MKPKILIVDDHEIVREGIRTLLARSGTEWEVCGEAANANDGIEAVKRLKPDIVIMDITMPKMDGLTALKAIRKIDPSARVAMVTAMGQQAIVMEALRAGAKDFVLKPFQPDRVLGALQKLLAS